MVAPRIHCIVVEIPVESAAIESRLRSPARDMLPDADPYIAALISKLQDEVRRERAAAQSRYPVNRLKFLGGTSLGMDSFADDGDSTEQDWPLLNDLK